MSVAEPDSHCLVKNCRDGNCDGCLNSRRYCDDPACSPYCRECVDNPNHEFYFSVWVALMVFILGTMIMLLYARKRGKEN